MQSQAVAVMTKLQRLASLDGEWNWANVAVTAREWRCLEPVRSYCELHHIQVQMADEDPPPVWRLRETQRLVDWLRKRESKLIDVPRIRQWLNQQSDGPWWDLLRQSVEEYALETGGAELPTDYFFEWLAEWGREVRRKQKGLLLLTAHRAKGLEFDHVAVLDGHWEKIGYNEDRDASRRLYYVVMTRARQTLTLACLDQRHPILDALTADPALLRRPPIQLPRPDPALARRYLRLTLSDVDLGFAGRYGSSHTVHKAISALATGNELQLVEKGNRWQLLDVKGNLVGRLARSFKPPPGMQCIQASVIAITTRLKKDTLPEYLDQVRSEHWEVILPELIFSDSKQD